MKCREDAASHILLEENWAESRIESTNAFSLQDLAEAANEAIGKCRFRDETNARGLERAKGDIGEELSARRRSKVYCGAVVAGGFNTN